MQDAGKEDYLRPSERIGLDWIELKFVCQLWYPWHAVWQSAMNMHRDCQILVGYIN